MNTYVNQLDYVYIADWVIMNNHLHSLNKRRLQNPYHVKPGDIIFVNTILLKYEHIYNTLVHIPVPYILITAICDETVPYMYDCDTRPTLNYHTLLNTPNLISWFGTNVDLDHPKIHPIPLGIPFSKPVHSDSDPLYKSPHCKYMGWYNNLFGVNEVFSKYNSISLETTNFFKPKPKLLFCNYTTVNSDECTIKKYKRFRYELDNYLLTHQILKQDLMNWEEYTEQLMNHKFTLSPPGRGIDTHRTYEALICGSIPIVFPSFLNKLYDDLPILVIDSFQLLNTEYLEAKYTEIISKQHYNFEKLSSHYWRDKIISIKNSIQIDSSIFYKK